LLITTLVVGKFVLRSALAEVGSASPRTVLILIVKNEARIVAVCLLTIYVDPRFLHGWLHMSGGIVFYVLGLIILLTIIGALRDAQKMHQPTFSVMDRSEVN